MTCDLQRWPLVRCVYDQAMDLQHYSSQLDDWALWLARKEPFALLRIYRSAAALQHPEGSAPLAKAWLQNTVPRLKGAVMAMATVVPASEYETLKQFPAGKLLGITAELFVEEAEAMDWLTAQMAAYSAQD